MRRSCLHGLGVIGLLLPALAWADFKVAYRDGVAAAERKDWARVEQLMRQALAEEPTPNPRVRLYGMRFEAYIPHFYLGLAAFERSDCRAALEHWQNAGHQAAVRGLREATRQTEMVGSCQSRLAAQPPPPAQVPAASPTPAPASQPAPAASPAQAPVSAAPVAAAPTRPPPTQPAPATAVQTPPTAAAAERLDAQRVAGTERRLSQNESRLAAAARDLGDPALASERAGRQRSQDALAQELRQLRGQFSEAQARQNAAQLAAVETGLNALEGRVQALERDIGAALERGRSADLAAVRSRLERAIDAAGSLRDAPGVASALAQGREAVAGQDRTRMLAAADSLERSTEAARQAASRQRTAQELKTRLRPLAEWYLAGDYPRLLAWRGDPELARLGEAQAQALLLRAAARFETYVLDGERDQALAEAAREDLRAARAAHPGLKPGERAFSPRFRAFFAQTR